MIKDLSPDEMIMLLTNREREVLNELACCRTAASISLHLGISPKTVEAHVHNIKEKLGGVSMTRLLQIAFAAGMGEPL